MELDCGIAFKRIRSWLCDELSLPCQNGVWTYAHEGSSCRVFATDLGKQTVNRVTLERTLLRVEGDGPAADEFMRLFTLRFISAGG